MNSLGALPESLEHTAVTWEFGTCSLSAGAGVNSSPDIRREALRMLLVGAYSSAPYIVVTSLLCLKPLHNRVYCNFQNASPLEWLLRPSSTGPMPPLNRIICLWLTIMYPTFQNGDPSTKCPTTWVSAWVHCTHCSFCPEPLICLVCLAKVSSYFQILFKEHDP